MLATLASILAFAAPAPAISVPVFVPQARAAQAPALSSALMKQRTNAAMYKWCKNKEIGTDSYKIRECDGWGVVKKSCFVRSLYEQDYGHCRGWMRLYDKLREDDYHCEARVDIHLYPDSESPTGWYVSSKRRAGTCHWEDWG